MECITVSEITSEMEYMVRLGNVIENPHETGTSQVWMVDGVIYYYDDCNGDLATFTDWDDLIEQLGEEEDMDSDNLLQWCKDLAKLYGEVDSMGTDPDGTLIAYVDGERVGMWDKEHKDGQVWTF